MTDRGYVGDDFVLRGTKPTQWEKPGHRKNSQCSSTAKQPTQSSHYAPENYRDYLDYGMLGESGTMKKSVSFNQRNGATAPVNGAEDTSPQSSTAGSILNGTAAGHKSKKEAASWYTRPVHLDIAFPSHSSVVVPRPSAVSPSGGPRLASKATNGCAFSPLDANGMDAAMSPRSGPGNSSLSSGAASSPSAGFNGQSMSLMTRPTSAPMVGDRTAGAMTTGSQTVTPTNNGFMSPPIGHSLTDMFAAGIKGHHRTASASFNDRVAVSDFYMEALASEYFPLTFGVPKPVELEVRQQPHIFNHATSRHSSLASSWRQPRRTKSPGRRRPGSAHSSSSSNSKSSIDKAYLMAVEAPAHAANSAVLLSTPYQQELAKLRMERLRIEEEHILEVKRQEELERIRGPRPKWYMMKSREFNYELHKNTELLQNKDNWQDLLDYRVELERASKTFQRSHNATS